MALLLVWPSVSYKLARSPAFAHTVNFSAPSNR